MDGVPRVKRAILLWTTLLALAGRSSVAWAAVPQGVWMVDGKAALQIYDCNGLMCGRLRWLDTPRDARGEPKRDKNNPNPTLRQRELCGLTLLWDLRPAGPDRWEGGHFYNPENGKTYNVVPEHTSSAQLAPPLYAGLPLLREAHPPPQP